jgi:hypothetical protein
MKEINRMNAVAKETKATKDFEQLKTRLKTTWMTRAFASLDVNEQEKPCQRLRLLAKQEAV